MSIVEIMEYLPFDDLNKTELAINKLKFSGVVFEQDGLFNIV